MFEESGSGSLIKISYFYIFTMILTLYLFRPLIRINNPLPE